MRRAFLLSLSLALPLAAHAQNATSNPVPEGAAITLEPVRPTYFLGENVVAYLGVANRGEKPFTIKTGGYNDGARWRLLETVTATDPNGEVVPDPDSLVTSFFGLIDASISDRTLQPSETWYQALSLPHYLDFEAPGTYSITAQHDLGWTAAPEHPVPKATTQVKMVMPTLEQAREVMRQVEAAPVEWKENADGKGVTPSGDYSILHYPIYLPLLMERIDAGKLQYLTSVEALATPEATRALVDHLGGDPTTARQFADIVVKRLPPIAPNPTAMTDERFAASFKLRQQLAEATWRPEFAVPTRNYARRALLSGEQQTLRTGAAILERIGIAEDLPALISTLDKRIVDTTRTPRWQDVGISYDDKGWYLQDDCLSLMRAASAILNRGAELNAPDSDGVIAIRLQQREVLGQTAWTPDHARYLRSATLFIRQMALESLVRTGDPIAPKPVLNADERALLPALLADRDTSVSAAACNMAGLAGDTTLLPNVLKVVESAQSQWLIGAANGAAAQLGGQFQVWTIWADRLDQPQMLRTAIVELSKVIERKSHGYSWSGADEPTEAAQLKPRWQKFLAANKERLQNGKLFLQTDADWPKDLFPKAFNISG